MRFYCIAVLYGGPDQLMPLTSSLAAILALLLIFWNKVLITLGKFLNLFKRTTVPADGQSSETPQIKE